MSIMTMIDNIRAMKKVMTDQRNVVTVAVLNAFQQLMRNAQCHGSTLGQNSFVAIVALTNLRMGIDLLMEHADLLFPMKFQYTDSSPEWRIQFANDILKSRHCFYAGNAIIEQELKNLPPNEGNLSPDQIDEANAMCRTNAELFDNLVKMLRKFIKKATKFMNKLEAKDKATELKDEEPETSDQQEYPRYMYNGARYTHTPTEKGMRTHVRFFDTIQFNEM